MLQKKDNKLKNGIKTKTETENKKQELNLLKVIFL